MTDSNILQAPLPQQPDGWFLHFLKELPSWCVIGVFIIIFLAMYNYTHEDFMPRIIDGLVGSLLTAIVSNRSKPPNTNINADTVQTPTLQTDSMDNATVNADTVTTTDQTKEK